MCVVHGTESSNIALRIVVVSITRQGVCKRNGGWASILALIFCVFRVTVQACIFVGGGGEEYCAGTAHAT